MLGFFLTKKEKSADFPFKATIQLILLLAPHFFTHFMFDSTSTGRFAIKPIASTIHKRFFPTFPPPAAESNNKGGTLSWNKLKSLLAKIRLNYKTNLTVVYISLMTTASLTAIPLTLNLAQFLTTL